MTATIATTAKPKKKDEDLTVSRQMAAELVVRAPAAWRRRLPRRSAVAGVAGLALLVSLGGCDSAGRGGGDGAGGEAGSASSAAPAPGGVPESRAWIERPELPFDYYSDLFIQAQSRASDLATADGGAWQAEQEEFIASCMKDKGFEYFPRVADGAEEDAESMVRAGDRRLWVPWLPEDLADVEKYGYGMLESEIVSQDSLGGSGAPDRNAEYTAALSASALREYRVALLGAELADYDLAAVDSVPMPEMGGCMGGASEAHPYPWIAVVEDSPTTLYEDLLDQMRAEAGDPYGERFARSADLDALNAEWRACFERDFSLAGPTVPADGSVAVGDPSGRLASESDGPTGAWDLAIHTDADGAYSDAAAGEAPPEYSSLTGSPREVAIAVADFKCRVETDYVDRFLGIEREAQEEFVAAHKAELDKMAAALEAYVNS